MSKQPPIHIDLTEQFGRLRQAPIVEAALSIRVHADNFPDEASVRSALRLKLQDYPNDSIERDVMHEFQVEKGQATRASTTPLNFRLRFESTDKKQIAKFSRSGFSFSRLQPYENWDRFLAEALKLWEVHQSIAPSAAAQKLGLRFINKLDMPLERPEEHFRGLPQPPEGLQVSFVAFFHQDTVKIPGHQYAIKSIRTVRPESSKVYFILDIDVVTTDPEIRPNQVASRLAEMRWLKNKMFFGIVTDRALEPLK